MHYVEAPSRSAYASDLPSLFLAGGITGCPDWQAEVVEMFQQHNVTVMNPRRRNFPIHDPAAAEEQITWEHHALREATCILFWFPAETLCPIVLYELGAWSMTKKPIVVGCHPNYQRKQDVAIQTRLARPDVELANSLSLLVFQAKLMMGLKP